MLSKIAHSTSSSDLELVLLWFTGLQRAKRIPRSDQADGGMRPRCFLWRWLGCQGRMNPTGCCSGAACYYWWLPGARTRSPADTARSPRLHCILHEWRQSSDRSRTHAANCSPARRDRFYCAFCTAPQSSVR
jgi:hypothetical protein